MSSSDNAAAGVDQTGCEDGKSGFAASSQRRSGGESLGERLLGSLIDRAHLLPPRLIGPLVAQEIAAIGGSDIAIYLQDYDQLTLRPLHGERLVGDPVPIDGTWAGRAFTSDTRMEEVQPDGSVRLYLPMLDGSDRVGVLAFSLPTVQEEDRRLAQRLAGLVADMVVTKSHYTDTFTRVRVTQPMTLSAQLQRQLLPPLSMTTPDVSVAGILEPAYRVGGDSFDYALNEHVLHLAVIDAMGHGLEAAAVATVVIGAYRHARRADAELVDLYAGIDEAVATLFPGRFATAHFGRLDTDSGELSWVNAGHPAAWLIRASRVIDELSGPTTLPVGFGGGVPEVRSVQLQPGDLVLFFTDGVVEERIHGVEQFGEARLRAMVEQMVDQELAAAEIVRRLSHGLTNARHGQTSDDASLLLIQWHGPPDDEELARRVP